MTRYFAYGSNLLTARMRERGAAFARARPAILRGHRLVFDKRGFDGSARANVAPDAGGVVHGVVYDLPGEGLEALRGFEGGYDLAEVQVEVSTEEGGVELLGAAVFVARPDRRTGAAPTRAYVSLILEGLAEHGLPPPAREAVERAAGRPPRAG